MTRDWTQKYFDIKGDEPDAYEEIKSELSKVKQQLAIAVEILWKVCDGRDSREYYSELAEEALQQIKELNK